MEFSKGIFYVSMSLLFMLMAACTSQATPVDTGPPITAESPVASPLPPKVVLDAQQWLASQLNVQTAQVQIIDIERVDWSDSCLGLGRANESCAAVVTPGWKAIFEVSGSRYEVRTDETGSAIRLATSEEAPSLENTQWNLVSLGSPGSETPIVEGSSVTLLLSNGQAGGFGGCNSYGGMYQLTEAHISFDQITSTLKACADNSMTEQEQDYFQALQAAGTYEVMDNQLRITYDEGSGVLIFESAVQAFPTPTVELPGG